MALDVGKPDAVVLQGALCQHRLSPEEFSLIDIRDAWLGETGLQKVMKEHGTPFRPTAMDPPFRFSSALEALATRSTPRLARRRWDARKLD